MTNLNLLIENDIPVDKKLEYITRANLCEEALFLCPHIDHCSIDFVVALLERIDCNTRCKCINKFLIRSMNGHDTRMIKLALEYGGNISSDNYRCFKWGRVQSLKYLFSIFCEDIMSRPQSEINCMLKSYTYTVGPIDKKYLSDKIKLLLEYNFDTVDYDNHIFKCCCKHGLFDEIKLLIDRGLKIESLADDMACCAKTFLHKIDDPLKYIADLSIDIHNEDIIAKLTESIIKNNNAPLLQYLIKGGIPLDIYNIFIKTLERYKPNAQMLELLLDHCDFDINVHDSQILILFSSSISFRYDYERKLILKLLLQHGINMNAHNNQVLENIISMWNVDIVRMLAEYKVDFSSVSEEHKMMVECMLS